MLVSELVLDVLDWLWLTDLLWLLEVAEHSNIVVIIVLLVASKVLLVDRDSLLRSWILTTEQDVCSSTVFRLRLHILCCALLLDFKAARLYLLLEVRRHGPSRLRLLHG